MLLSEIVSVEELVGLVDVDFRFPRTLAPGRGYDGVLGEILPPPAEVFLNYNI